VAYVAFVALLRGDDFLFNCLLGRYAKDGRIQLEFLHDKLDSLFSIPHLLNKDYDNP
jgi:hypothetical protein